MILRDLSPTELAQLVINLVAVLSGTELTAIDSHVRTTLIAEFGTMPTDLATQDAQAETLKLQAAAIAAARDLTADSVLVVARKVRDYLKANKAPREQFELCGFDFSDTTRSPYVAQTPSDLAVVGFSNSVNKGKFRGNNKSGSVNYEVWRREGDEGDWMLRTVVRPPRFIDEGVTPGQYYEYKVRARASSNVSLFSNSAVVYGLGATKPAG